MPFEERIQPQPHSICIDSRESIEITGALDVESFGEECIIVITTMGKLTIKGEKLHINKFSVDEGTLSACGTVTSAEYSRVREQEAGFFARLFK